MTRFVFPLKLASHNNGLQLVTANLPRPWSLPAHWSVVSCNKRCQEAWPGDPFWA